MFQLLVVLIVAIFVALVFVNFYFRTKVLKVYKRLVNNRIEFGAKDIFNSARLEEVCLRYPNHKSDIQLFANQIHRSFKFAILLIFAITVLGLLLMLSA